MHDGAPCHATNSVKSHLDKHGTKVLDWPLRKYMKYDIRQIECTNQVELIGQLTKAWHKIPEISEKTRQYVPRRVNALIKASIMYANKSRK